MRLAQNNLFQINVNEHILGINFEKIEKEFQKLRKQMSSIKRASINIIGKINQLDPFDQLEMEGIDQESREMEQLNKEKGKKEGSLISRIQIARPGTNQSNRDNSKESIMEMNNDLVQICTNSKKKKLSIKKSLEMDQHQSQRSLFKQRKSNDFLKRILELENLSQEQEERITDLQKDGALLRRNLGMKLNKKQKTEFVKPQESSRKQSPRKQASEPSEKEIKQNDSEENSENEDNECNVVSQLSKQINEIRDYLTGKLKSIDNQLANTSDRLNKESVKLNQQTFEINRKVEEIKNNIDNGTGEQAAVFLKPNSNKSPPSSLHKTRSTHEGNSRILNETMESYRAYYQDKIVQIFQEMDNLKKEYIQIIEKMSEDEKVNGVVGEKDQQRLKNIVMRIGSSEPSKIDETIKKQVINLKKDYKKFKHQFDNLMVGVNSGSNQTRTLVIKPNETKEDWKTLSQKIHKVRQECLGAVKDLENKIIGNNDMIVSMNQFEVGLEECKIMLNKKTDAAENEKNMKRLENRLNNFIRQICEKQGTNQQQDAMVVRQPWFCLSCDTEIKNYTGKPTKPTYNQKLQGKKVNPESHMIRRNQNSRLPSLH